MTTTNSSKSSVESQQVSTFLRLVVLSERVSKEKEKTVSEPQWSIMHHKTRWRLKGSGMVAPSWTDFNSSSAPPGKTERSPRTSPSSGRVIPRMPNDKDGVWSGRWRGVSRPKFKRLCLWTRFMRSRLQFRDGKIQVEH